MTVATLGQPGGVTAQEPALEGLPDYMLNLVHPEALTGTSVGFGRSYGWMDSAIRWEPGRTIRVCFFGGPREARQAIAAAASEWNGVGANLRLDFGDMFDPRICGIDPIPSQIRVGFNQRGYWSVLGKEAELAVPQGLPTMNLQRFDFMPPDEVEFRRLVLHEFGHALGLGHEHQMAQGGCETEYDWNYVYSWLQGPPNYWSVGEIDANIRGQRLLGRQVGTTFDVSSVMLYAFPPQFYRMGTSSPCFSGGMNARISPGDAAAMRIAYPHGGSDTRLYALAEGFEAARSQDERDALLAYALTPEEVEQVQTAQAEEARFGLRYRVDQTSYEVALRERERVIAANEAAYEAWERDRNNALREGLPPPPPVLLPPPPFPPAPPPPAPPGVTSGDLLRDGRVAAAGRLSAAGQRD